MVDLLGNIVFSGFLLITAGASLALQAGNRVVSQVHLMHNLLTLTLHNIHTNAFTGCNSNLARNAGRTFAPLWSFGSGLICCLIFFVIDTQALKTPLPDQSLLSEKRVKLDAVISLFISFIDAPGYVWIGKRTFGRAR